MILFFRTPTNSVIATECNQELNAEDVKKLCWLYSDATVENEDNLKGWFIGPRREMITPWSTNAVEITQNMGLNGIRRIEEYFPVKDENADHDPMLQRMYHGLDQEIFTVDIKPHIHRKPGRIQRKGRSGAVTRRNGLPDEGGKGPGPQTD